jgi:hypothetical protein
MAKIQLISERKEIFIEKLFPQGLQELKNDGFGNKGADTVDRRWGF